MQPAPGKAPGGDPPEASLAIERFLKASKKPVLMEAGEKPFAVSPETFVITIRGTWVVLECWDARRNLSRRVTGVKSEKPGRLELDVERFGQKDGTLTLADLARGSNQHLEKKGERLQYREHFRESLYRQFPDWRVSAISSEQDLHNSFSPVYPRAFLRRGNTGLAAIGAPADKGNAEAALSFGLIWLDYLRRREPRVTLEGLVLFVPAGHEHALCQRVRFLNTEVAQYAVFVHSGAAANETQPYEQQVDPNDYTNLDTRLDAGTQERTRFSSRQHFSPPNAEVVLESKIRAQIEEIDATLLPNPVYGQIPQFAGPDRGRMDLLAVDRDGRLAVLELKVDQEIHLPLQALDYWMRVKWHLDRGEFAARGFFPGIALSKAVPRILLVAPAMEFHPTNETVLRYLKPEIPVERIGIGVEWRRELKVVYRPPVSLWPSPFFDKSSKP